MIDTHHGLALVYRLAGGLIEVGFAYEAPCDECAAPLGDHAEINLRVEFIERTDPVPKYLTRVREVRAERFDGTRVSAIHIQATMPAGSCFYGEYAGAFVVNCKTANGNIAQARAGDYVILGKGECYPCTPEEFDLRYEPAPEAGAPTLPVVDPDAAAYSAWAAHCAAWSLDPAADEVARHHFLVGYRSALVAPPLA